MHSQLIYKILYFELLCSLIDCEKIVHWADEKIIENNEPEEILLDLSLTSCEEQQFDLLGILDSTQENAAFEWVAIELLNRYNSGTLNFFDVTNKLLLMYYHSAKLAPETMDFIHWLDDESMLIAEGVKKIAPAKQALHEFLLAMSVKNNKNVENSSILSSLHPLILSR